MSRLMSRRDFAVTSGDVTPTPPDPPDPTENTPPYRVCNHATNTLWTTL